MPFFVYERDALDVFPRQKQFDDSNKQIFVLGITDNDFESGVKEPTGEFSHVLGTNDQKVLFLYNFFQPFGRYLRLIDETAPEGGNVKQ